MEYFDAQNFSYDMLKSLKGSRKIAVVFSTFGEREAELVAQKIGLFHQGLGELADTILLSHRRTGEKADKTEDEAYRAWEGTDILICNSYPVPDMKEERGKGADMRRALYYLITEKGYTGTDVIVYLDSDVVSELFGLHFFYGLAGAVCSGVDFAKASFWREMGRVKKYTAQPLFSVIEHQDLKGLTEMGYPLSGEVAGTIDFFSSVSYWQLYGVETGINVDATTGSYKVGDVNLGRYDHEHSGDGAIQKMAFGIIRTYLKKLEEKGFLELKKGARISDQLCASYIDEEGLRGTIDADLTEIEYSPLRTIL